MGLGVIAATCFGSAAAVGNTIAGASLAATSIQAIATSNGAYRTAAHEVSNNFQDKEFVLKFKNYHLTSGLNNLSAQPTINAGEKEAMCFKKVHDTACGTVGVYVYTVHGQKDGIAHQVDVAVMWSVPYDYNWYSNWVAIKIDHCLNPSQQLYEEMYYNSEYGFKREPATKVCTFSNLGITARATMSNVGQSTIKVEIGPAGKF